MASFQPKHRLRVQKVPSTEAIPHPRRPNFPSYDKLYLDLLENKNRVKRNAPIPVFVRNSNSAMGGGDDYGSRDRGGSDESRIDDFTLEDLEKAYGDSSSGSGGGGYQRQESDYDDDRHGHGSGRNDRYSGSRSDGSDGESLSDSSSYAGRGFYDSRSSRPEPPSRSQPASYNQPSSQPSAAVQSSSMSGGVVEEPPEEDPEVLEMREKHEYLLKFLILKRKYPELELPEFTEHSDLRTMKNAYEFALRRAHLDHSVESYRGYLIGGSMAMEWAANNWFGVDMTGFTSNQMKNQKKYDRLLLELGEKNYSPEGSRFPVEVRLLFMMLMQAGMFVAQKMMTGGGNNNNATISTPSPPTNTTTTSSPNNGTTNRSTNINNNNNYQTPRTSPIGGGNGSGTTRMRGPTIRPQDIDVNGGDGNRIGEGYRSTRDKDD